MVEKEKIQEAPEGWGKTKLGLLADYINGYAFKPADWKKEGYPIVRIEQLKDSKANYDYSNKKIPTYNIIEDGDLIFSWSASLSLNIWNRGKAYLNQHLYKVIEKNGINRQFLKFLIESKLERLIAASHGSTMQHITRPSLLNFKVIIPNGETEQHTIASVLSTCDAAIEKTDAKLEKLKRIKQGLMQDLFRYGIDENGKMRSEAIHRFKDSPLGRIPEEWEVVEIKEIAKNISDKNFKNNNNPVMSCTKYKGLVESLEYFQGRKIFSDNLQSYKTVKYDCFAYATNHIEEGSIGLQNKFKIALVSPMYTVFETNEIKINTNWLFKVLKSDKYVEIYKFKTTATVNRRGSLRWNQFSEIKITLPSKQEQTIIDKILSSADEAIEKEEAYKNKLLALKRGLMDDLLSGKVRVNKLIKEAA